MTLAVVIPLLFVLTAALSYVNYRFMRLPPAIGLLLGALTVSLLLIFAGLFGFDGSALAEELFNRIDFGKAVMHGMLSILLFASALHINVAGLAQQRVPVLMLSSVGVIISSVVVGCGIFVVMQAFGFPMSFAYCLVFGALISPTDAIAVMALLKRMKVRRSLEAKIVGESLFNDGMGVACFVVFLTFATGQREAIGIGEALILLLWQVGGGIALGTAAGSVVQRLLRGVRDYQVEVLMTLALATGVYALALHLDTSAPIAVVVAGMLVGESRRSARADREVAGEVDNFWKVIDEIINAVLFVLIGLYLLMLPYDWREFAASVFAIPVVLAARWTSVATVMGVLRPFRNFSRDSIRVLTWSGIRGGVSIALALSLPDSPARELIVSLTYVVVAFSVLVQGLTLGRLLPREE